MIEAELYNRLQNTVGSLVGGTSGAFTTGFSTGFVTPTTGRIYPTKGTEDTQIPCIVYTINSTTPEMTLRGKAGLTKYTATLDIYSVDADTGFTIAEAIEQALHGWHEPPVLLSTITNGQSIPQELGYRYSQEVNITKRTNA